MEWTPVFSSSEILKRSKGYSYQDVLMVPQFSEMESRTSPSLQTRLTKNFSIDLPIIAANMDTVTEVEMAIAMAELGGIGILHRFMTTEEQVEQVKLIQKIQNEKKLTTPIAASTGVKEEGIERAKALIDAGVNIITIDIAHGDSIMMIKIIETLKKMYPRVDIIAGNVATPKAAIRLIEAGADAIKIGIGPGSMCTTRLVTGCGVPQMTAVALVSEYTKKYQIPLIADGGIKHAGDIVKAFAVGAQSVMLGGMLSGTDETPGEIVNGKKLFRGMASKSAQVSWRGGIQLGLAPEGEMTKVHCKGPVKSVIHELSGGIRSGMTYLNAKTISEISLNAEFIEITESGRFESGPHGLN